MTVLIESSYGYFIDSSFLITLYLGLCLSGLSGAVYLQNKLNTDIYNKIIFKQSIEVIIVLLISKVF